MSRLDDKEVLKMNQEEIQRSLGFNPIYIFDEFSDGFDGWTLDQSGTVIAYHWFFLPDEKAFWKGTTNTVAFFLRNFKTMAGQVPKGWKP